jgi:hypothetical protein
VSSSSVLLKKLVNLLPFKGGCAGFLTRRCGKLSPKQEWKNRKKNNLQNLPASTSSKGVGFQSKAVIHRRWCRKPENYTYVKPVGDNTHLSLESGIPVATTQTRKDRKPRTGKRPPSDKTAAGE